MKIFKYLLSSMFIFIQYSPVYASGFEDVSLFKTIAQLIFYLVIFIGVIFITLYGTKFIAKNYKGFSGSKYMKIIDSLNIQNGIKLVIVSINKKIYILSVSSTSTNLIDTIDPEDIEEDIFDNYLKKHMDKTDMEESNINLYVNKIKKRIKFSKDEEDKR